MPRKVNDSNKVLKRKRGAERDKGKGVTKDDRRFYLIVCEGEKTEPYYFQALKKSLRKNLLATSLIEIRGTGMNTMSLIKEALRLKEECEKNTGKVVDKIWAVLDKDSFSANDFNSAIHRCKHLDVDFECAWSNESFELWYLLHFNYYNHPISRKDYRYLIEENLKPYLGVNWRYEKNSEDMFNLLHRHGCQQTAIRNAKRLQKKYTGQNDFANHNPCTMVYKLVEELINLQN